MWPWFDRDPAADLAIVYITSEQHVDVQDDAVNADSAKSGDLILNSMTGKTVSNFTFQRKNKAFTLASKSSLKVGEKEIHIDSELFIQRLVTAGERSELC